MKKYFYIFAVTLFVSVTHAQEKLNNVAIPTSPASWVLGIQPTSVLSPKSYQALEATIFSNVLNDTEGLAVPNDFALEFTPYWTADHSLSLEDYLYPKDVFSDQIIRNSSFSLASTQNFLLGDSTATSSIALGYRTTFYFSNQRDRQIVKDFRNKLSFTGSIITAIISEAETLIPGDKNNFLRLIRETVEKEIRANFDDEAAEFIINAIFMQANNLPDIITNEDQFKDQFYKILIDILQAEGLFQQFKEYIRNRQGLSVDLAYAAFLNFPTNNFEFSLVPRQSLWITPTYRFSDNMSFLKVLGVFRYEWYNIDYYRDYFPQSEFYENNVDYGFAIAGVFEKFLLQFELVGRSSNSEIPAGLDDNGNELFIKESSSDIQYVGTFSYLLTDQIALTYSLGKRFDPVLNPDNTLVSLLSLNFGFGGATTDDIKLEQ